MWILSGSAVMVGLHQRFARFCMRKYERLFHLAERKWPKHVAAYSGGYQRVKEGVGVTFTDFSQFLRVSYKRFGMDIASDLSGLSRYEIRLLRTVPRDMVRLTPLLIAVALPGTIAILPLFLAFPRLLLTRNFWNEGERRHFDSLQLRLHLLGPHADLTRQLTFLASSSSSAPTQVSGPNVLLHDHVSEPTSLEKEHFSEERRLLRESLVLVLCVWFTCSLTFDTESGF
uniref:LETM1-like protein n=2 Tax=Schistocephalus solidus TaxID=70667 RepID=A0A0X3Q1N3_SCHSO